MPELRWDEIDLIDYFAVLPEVEEYGISHTFRVAQDSLVLTMKIWENESVIHLTLNHPDNATPIVAWFIAVKGQLELVGQGESRRLRITGCIPVPSRFYYSDWEINVFTMPFPGLTLDICIAPAIAIAYIRE